MTKVTDLVFKKIEDENAPDFTCNMCNKKAPGKGFLYANIQIASDAHFMVVICSEKCQRDFVSHKFVNKYLTDQVSKMRREHRSNAIKNMGKK
jgi:hypothetical protein